MLFFAPSSELDVQFFEQIVDHSAIGFFGDETARGERESDFGDHIHDHVEKLVEVTDSNEAQSCRVSNCDRASVVG